MFSVLFFLLIAVVEYKPDMIVLKMVKSLHTDSHDSQVLYQYGAGVCQSTPHSHRISALHLFLSSLHHDDEGQRFLCQLYPISPYRKP